MPVSRLLPHDFNKICLSLVMLTSGLTCIHTSVFAQKHSTNTNGMIGLNTIPTARMDEKNTARIGTSFSDPYLNAYLGLQIAEPLYIGVRLSLPLGAFKYIPDNAGLNINSKPFGRDIAQRLNNPAKLYDLTQPLSQAHLVKNWQDIVP